MRERKPPPPLLHLHHLVRVSCVLQVADGALYGILYIILVSWMMSLINALCY